MTDGARAITDDEQERATAIVDALSARGVKLILKNVPGRKYLKVAISVPQGVRVPMDVKQIVQAKPPSPKGEGFGRRLKSTEGPRKRCRPSHSLILKLTSSWGSAP